MVREWHAVSIGLNRPVIKGFLSATTTNGNVSVRADGVFSPCGACGVRLAVPHPLCLLSPAVPAEAGFPNSEFRIPLQLYSSQ